MASASCNTTATELEMKLMVPSWKLVPIFRRAATPKVIISTGTSA